eukprot:2991617-Amphidinium_carterae.1
MREVAKNTSNDNKQLWVRKYGAACQATRANLCQSSEGVISVEVSCAHLRNFQKPDKQPHIAI